MGRPPKPENERATSPVGVRLTRADRELLARLAELERADRQARGEPGEVGASELLRGLLHREGRARGLLPVLEERGGLSTVGAPRGIPRPSGSATHPAAGLTAGGPQVTPSQGAALQSAPMAEALLASPLSSFLPPGAVVMIWPAGYSMPVPGVAYPSAAWPPSSPAAPATPVSAEPVAAPATALASAELVALSGTATVSAKPSGTDREVVPAVPVTQPDQDRRPSPAPGEARPRQER